MSIRAIDTSFIPARFVVTTFDSVASYFSTLQQRAVSTAAELERWILDRSELEAVCSERKASLYIGMTCDTEKKEIQEEYARFVTQVQPELSKAFFELDKRQADLSTRIALPERYEVLTRSVKASVDLFREENVPVESELAQLGQRYEQVIGAMTVHFEGQERTLPAMSKFLEATDRGLRERAWHAMTERRLQDAQAIENIYAEMIVHRQTLARNAGLPTFVEYAFKSMQRFDYTPEDCRRFHEGVEVAVLPLVKELERQRAASLQVPTLRPWDMMVDVKGREPLRPFDTGTELMSRSVEACRRLDPRLGDMLSQLGRGDTARGSEGGASLDLESRKGKALGGYQFNLERSRRPFIFMNAVGMQRDVVTMVHEAGHAFHFMLCRDEPVMAYRSSPIEFAEVASMSMELLTMPHLGRSGPRGNDGRPVFFENDEEFARARREVLEQAITRLPWIATIDSFQLNIYATPGISPEDRQAEWMRALNRFAGIADWSGLEKHRPFMWQRQMHLFSNPLYYIEYGIAQLGALELWLVSKERGEAHAVDAYIRALSLGGSRPLPELFRAAGLTFDFGPEALKRLVDRVAAELETA